MLNLVLGNCIAHLRSASGGLCFILKFRLYRIYSFGDTAIFIFWHFGLKLPIHAHFDWVFGAYFPHMTSSIVLIPKRHLLARKHVVWAIKRKNQSKVRHGRVPDRVKMKEQDRTVKNATKALCFTYSGRSPHWTDFHRNVHSSCRPERNHVCKLLNWNFQGLRFYRQQYRANALPVINVEKKRVC